MGRLCRPFEGPLIEFEHRGRRGFRCERGSLQHLMVKRDGEFAFLQASAQQNVETVAANNGLRRRRSSQWIKQKLWREAQLNQLESAV